MKDYKNELIIKTGIMSIGKISIMDGAVVVSDPCTLIGEEEMVQLFNVSFGNWECYIEKASIPGLEELPTRVKTLTIVHESEKLEDLKFELYEEKQVCVDSGCIGIFGIQNYQNDNVFRNHTDYSTLRNSEDYEPGYVWYTLVMEHGCLHEVNDNLEIMDVIHTHAETIPFGVMSTSGLGDGEYSVETAKDTDGKIVGIKIDMF